MKRSLRARPAVAPLEDRWCPAYTATFSPAGQLNVLDGDTLASLSIARSTTAPASSNTFLIHDNSTVDPSPDGTFSGVTNLEVTMGGTQDTLDINLNYNTGTASTNTVYGALYAGTIGVALDGTAPSGSPNSFTFENGNINNNNASGTLFVLGQGAYNNVTIGDGVNPTAAVGINVLYRDASNGPNVGTVNVANTTTVKEVWTDGVVFASQDPSATDSVSLGSAAGLIADYGGASFSFGNNNPFTLSMANGFVGNSAIRNTQLQVHGGGSGSTVNLGDGTTSFTVATPTTLIDLDDTSGGSNGTINVNAKVTLQSATQETFDDYGTVRIAPNGGNVTLTKPLTIWNSDGGSNVILGDALNVTPGTISGSITFDTGRISLDSDDAGSGAGVMDNLTLQSLEKLSGSLMANLNTSMDTIDVEGHVTGSVSVSTGNGNQTIQVGQTTPATALIDAFLSITFGGNGFKELDFNGTVGAPSSTGNTLIVTTSSANSFVQVNLGNPLGGFQGTAYGKTRLLLAASPAEEIDFYGLNGLDNPLRLSTATGNGGPNANYYLHGHTNIITTGWTGFIPHA